jgi:6-hydroxytryprostatin B O-methyltransferase
MLHYLYQLLTRVMSPLISNSVPFPVSEDTQDPKSLPAGKDDLLSELASSISSNAQIVSTFLHSEGHSAPSFGRDAASTVVPATAPTDVQVAREALLEASMKMFQLASGPREYLPNLAVHVGFFPLFFKTLEG